MYELTWTQAQEAMREGKRVKNRHFTDDEFFYMENGQLWDEMGYRMAGWYKGYAWQEEGWMVIGENPNLFHKVEEWHNQDYSALEDRVIALFTGGCYTVDTMDYWVGVTPRSPTLPREKENYNFRITKGKGHNKLQKRKKK